LATISFIKHNVAFSLKNKKDLTGIILHLFKKENNVDLESLTYIFCTDQYLRKLNRRFLNHDYYTDILTFVLSDKGNPLVSEIYISIDRVKENSQKLNISQHNELLRVIFHGALHLCGYNDNTDRQKIRMRQKEDEYLNMLRST
jgi:rRNA maturation RNase YbeY